MKLFKSNLFCLILVMFIVQTASAHAPIASGENESLSAATVVSDPSKSWAIYATLHEAGEGQYYKFDASQGQKLHVMLYTSSALADLNFTPNLLLMGPGIPNQGSVPSNIEVPEGAGVMVVNGIFAAQATYEAFAPSSYVELAEITLDAPAVGTYYVAVIDDERGGNYGVAIGDRESFTVSEWIFNPIALLSVYRWEGQSLPIVFAPALVILVIGIFLLRRQRTRQPLDSAGWFVAIAGLLFLGTAVTVLSQMLLVLRQAPADGFVIVTLLFALLPLILGWLAIRLALRNSGKWTLQARRNLILLGGSALFLWAGFIIGPILTIVAAVIPSKEG